MATAEQLKALVRSHLSDDDERFYALALQVAAHEAQQGHGALALELRDLVDKARRKRTPNVLLQFPQELSGLIDSSRKADIPRAALILEPSLQERISRIILEHRQREKLRSHGMTNRRKILLSGPPGTGKTMTAQVLAHELRLPYHTIQIDKLVTKFMGETSAKLRQIFDVIRDRPGVYLFDEFDAIGGDRSLDNDVGEMRRVLNALLQFIEQDTSESIIVAATNNPALLDRALFRRFDDVLIFALPDAPARQQIMENILGTFKGERMSFKTALTKSAGLSHSEIDQACRDTLKDAILKDKKVIDLKSLVRHLCERHSAHPR